MVSRNKESPPESWPESMWFWMKSQHPKPSLSSFEDFPLISHASGKGTMLVKLRRNSKVHLEKLLLFILARNHSFSSDKTGLHCAYPNSMVSGQLSSSPELCSPSNRTWCASYSTSAWRSNRAVEN